jgi:hypothetical protein
MKHKNSAQKKSDFKGREKYWRIALVSGRYQSEIVMWRRRWTKSSNYRQRT